MLTNIDRLVRGTAPRAAPFRLGRRTKLAVALLLAFGMIALASGRAGLPDLEAMFGAIGRGVRLIASVDIPFG